MILKISFEKSWGSLELDFNYFLCSHEVVKKIYWSRLELVLEENVPGGWHDPLVDV